MNIQDELLHIDKVIMKLFSRDKLMAIEPDIRYLIMWGDCYAKGRENNLNSLGWLFANEYYRTILEGGGL